MLNVFNRFKEDPVLAGIFIPPPFILIFLVIAHESKPPVVKDIALAAVFFLTAVILVAFASALKASHAQKESGSLDFNL